MTYCDHCNMISYLDDHKRLCRAMKNCEYNCTCNNSHRVCDIEFINGRDIYFIEHIQNMYHKLKYFMNHKKYLLSELDKIMTRSEKQEFLINKCKKCSCIISC